MAYSFAYSVKHIAMASSIDLQVGAAIFLDLQCYLAPKTLVHDHEGHDPPRRLAMTGRWP